MSGEYRGGIRILPRISWIGSWRGVMTPLEGRHADWIKRECRQGLEMISYIHSP